MGWISRSKLSNSGKAVRACNRLFGRTWGLSPKLSFYYNCKANPNLRCPCLVWIAVVKKVNTQKLLSKVQRLGLGITAAMSTCPTAAIEAIIGQKKFWTDSSIMSNFKSIAQLQRLSWALLEFSWFWKQIFEMSLELKRWEMDPWFLWKKWCWCLVLSLCLKSGPTFLGIQKFRCTFKQTHQHLTHLFLHILSAIQKPETN
jgi:hypothetical protein